MSEVTRFGRTIGFYIGLIVFCFLVVSSYETHNQNGTVPSLLIISFLTGVIAWASSVITTLFLFYVFPVVAPYTFVFGFAWYSREEIMNLLGSPEPLPRGELVALAALKMFNATSIAPVEPDVLAEGQEDSETAPAEDFREPEVMNLAHHSYVVREDIQYNRYRLGQELNSVAVPFDVKHLVSIANAFSMNAIQRISLRSIEAATGLSRTATSSGDECKAIRDWFRRHELIDDSGELTERGLATFPPNPRYVRK